MKRLMICLVLALAVTAFARPIGETTIAYPLDANDNVEVSLENSDATVDVANASLTSMTFDDSGMLVQLLQRYGDLYMATYTFTAVADSDSVEVVLDAAVGSRWGFQLYADKTTIVTLNESFAYSDSGTALTAYNMDRTSSATATSDVSHTPTDTDAGTEIWAKYVAASTDYSSEMCGVFIPFTLDTLASDSVDYCLDIENNGSGDMAGTVTVYWLE